MITLEDMIGLCGLTREEVAAIAEHEHIAEPPAAALADYLLHVEHGTEVVRGMIRDDIRDALAAGDKDHARTLVHALAHFIETHPECLGQKRSVSRHGRN